MVKTASQKTEFVRVEVVVATPEHQELVSLEVTRGTTVADAVDLSGVKELFSEINLAGLQVGVWGQPVSAGHELQEGDRVELYRPLLFDPRDARRDLAAVGKIMGQDSIIGKDDRATGPDDS